MTDTVVSFEILYADGPDRARWLGMLDEWPQREIFAEPAYLELYLRPGDRAVCFVHTSELGVVIYPVILRDLRAMPFWRGRELFDIAPPPFGYAGPFTLDARPSPEQHSLLDAFYRDYSTWAQEHGVIAEYTLFSPFQQPPERYPGTSFLRIPTVVRSLDDVTEEEMFSGYRKSHRRDIRAAQKTDLSVTFEHTPDHVQEFLDIHWEIMDRRQGLDAHRLTPEFLERLHTTLPGKYVYSHAWQDGKIISSDLTLISGRTVMSFRGGTLPASLGTGAGKLLQHEGFVWAKQEGKESVLIGGGVSGRDDLYSYKLGFAPNGERELWAGQWCIAGDAYREVLAARQAYESSAGNDWNASQGFFPAYRA